jgi:hypothetical protein
MSEPTYAVAVNALPALATFAVVNGITVSATPLVLDLLTVIFGLDIDLM